MAKGLNKIVQQSRAESGAWFIDVEGYVERAEIVDGVPCVKALIPIIHEDYIHDDWIVFRGGWVGGDGYGSVNLPAQNSRVLINGRLGQKHNLSCVSCYDEECKAPDGFENAFGFKEKRKYRALSDDNIEIVSERQLLLEGKQQADVVGEVVRLIGGNTEVVRAEANKIGFLGAPATPRTPLPPPGPTDTPLTIAIRQLLITKGLAR